MRSAVEGANSAILDEVTAHPEEKGMGTTCTAAVFAPTTSPSRRSVIPAPTCCATASSSCSRAMTMASQMVDAGLLEPDQVAHFPFRHVLSQALGTTKPLAPVITNVALQEGDRVLLCSDGLHGPVPDDAISAILTVSGDVAEAARALVAAALAAGGPDNVTVVVAHCGRVEGASENGGR